MKTKHIALILIFFIATVFVSAERWPMGPGNTAHPVGNYYSMFLDFGGWPYFHDGLDFMGESGDPVYSVSHGYVREIYVSDPIYSGLFITYSSSGQDLGWAYWHITSTTMPFIEGDEVNDGDYLGDIATWPIADFHHLHFTRCRYPGNDGAWYDAVANPIEFLIPPDEPDAPVFQEAQTGQMFSFVENNTDTPVDKSSVYGQVDIIARISDRIVDPTWIVIPYRIEWWVENTDEIQVVPTRLFVTHTGDCFDGKVSPSVVYKDSGIWDTSADYTAATRKFYWIVTNTDGDGVAEPTDNLFAFYSNSLANGDYTLFVRASDWAGNSTTESMEFTVNNATGENSLDIVHVLDRSGSMGGYANDSSTDRKIDVLKLAADQFIQMMKPDIGNRLGIVQFNQNVVDFPTPEPDLTELTSGNFEVMRDSVDSMSHGGSTSIGDGLREAHTQLTDIGTPNPLQAVLLISDGKENTAEMISTVQGDLISDGIKVYSLGLGYSTGIEEEKLTDLSDATFGDYRITSDDLEFRKFFLDVLADAANWEVITDPTNTLGSEPALVPTPVSVYDRKVIFTVYWEGQNADNGVSLSLITPSGKTIGPSVDHSNIKYVYHRRYAFYEVKYPLTGKYSGDHGGTWQMKLVKNQGAGTIRYAYSAYSDSAVEFDAAFSSKSIATGQKITLTGRLTKGGIPVKGAKIDVYGDVPLVWAGNVLRTPVKDLNQDMTADSDPVGLAEQKLIILSGKSKRNLLKRGASRLTLYDDGEHGDNNMGDGIYANSFTDTRTPGSYTFRFVASNIPSGGEQTITREWAKTFFNKVNIDPEASIIRVNAVTSKDGYEVKRVKVVPKDKFGNYMGPGHSVKVIVSYAGKEREVLLQDNIDGSYTGDIMLTSEEKRENADILFEVDNKAFNPDTLFSKKRWMISFHGGLGYPTGAFSRDFKRGLCLFADLGYKFTPNAALVLYGGYNSFKTKQTVYNDTYWLNLSLNLKFYLPGSGPFGFGFGGGGGLYFPETGNAKFGANGGLFLAMDVGPSVTLELGADYHVIFKGIESYDPAKTGNMSFITAHLGLVLHF